MKILTILVSVRASCMALGLIWQGTELRKREAANQMLRAEAAQLSELRGEAERLRQITVDKGELGRLRDSETARLQEIARLRRQLGPATLSNQRNSQEPGRIIQLDQQQLRLGAGGSSGQLA